MMFLQKVTARINVLRRRKTRFHPLLDKGVVKDALVTLQDRFVFVPTDKAGNNIAIACKKNYIEQSMRELVVFGSTRSANPTYERIKLKAEAIVKRHKAYLKKKLNLNDIPEDLPFIYWIPKLHKKPFSKQRFISASYKCSTKPLSALLTKCYSLIQKTHKQASSRYFLCGLLTALVKSKKL